MISGKPSRTAYGAALQRAAHQILDDGRIFSDPIAVRILGLEEEEIMREIEIDPPRRRIGFRISIAVRSRFAENRLEFAIRNRGVCQYVILGAGLDTFAYRSPYGPNLKVFEVDYPDTQAWKRERLREAGIDVPDWLVYAPVDFETEHLPPALARAGFDPAARTLFSWLGVVIYLRREVVLATLQTIAEFPCRPEIVFDFTESPDSFPVRQREAFEQRKARVASFGEPWLSTFDPESLRAHLHQVGFTDILDLNPRQIAHRFFPAQAHGSPDRGGHLVHAVMP